MRQDDSLAESFPGPAAAPPGGDDFLLTPALSQRLDLIRHLTDFSRQIILVMGEEGGGKSALAAHLLARAPESWRTARLNADPLCNAETLLRRLAGEFHLHLADEDSYEERIQGVHKFVEITRHSLMVPVLLVDDAHLLAADALLLLLRLAQPESEGAHLRVVLFCDPRITRMLANPQMQAFKQSILHVIEMPAFTEDDTAAYLLHRTMREGGNEEDLSDDYVHRLHAAAGGNPGRINALLESAAPLDRRAGTGEMEARLAPIQIRYALAGAAVALVMATVLWAWQRFGDRFEPEAPAAVPPAQTGQMAPAAPPPAPPTQPPPVAVAPPPPPAAPAPPAPSPAASSAPAPAVVSVPQPVPPPPPEPAPQEAAPQSAVKGEDWLSKQPQQGYVLQLFGSYDRQTSERFIAQHNLSDKAAVYTTVRDNGRTLYMVVIGPYPDKTAAQSAAAELPPALKTLKPWPRSIGEIQTAMARNGDRQ